MVNWQHPGQQAEGSPEMLDVPLVHLYEDR